ncbi:hypothetical protein CDAR_574541, partial [Caerostris darwini]
MQVTIHLVHNHDTSPCKSTALHPKRRKLVSSTTVALTIGWGSGKMPGALALAM